MRQPPIVQRFRRRLGVRMRSALAAGAVVAVASVLAGGVLLITARGILLDNLSTTATDRAEQIAVSLSNDDAATLAASLRPSARDRTIVQVLNSAGRVTAASDAIAGLPPISELRPRAGLRAHE